MPPSSSSSHLEGAGRRGEGTQGGEESLTNFGGGERSKSRVAGELELSLRGGTTQQHWAEDTA